ncbi:hypothetical protein ACN4EG_10025 [Alkalinema pantanalense CENA528]|uniref:hypothetical protein n=1 Tax=Alkalinema pantanalense TaxID=1620705 RepID=UPI003D6EDC02
MNTQNVKTIARQLIDQLPENCSWEDLIEQIYVCQAIEAGLADKEAGRTKSVEDVRKMFGLNL